MASLTEAREAPARQLWDEIAEIHAGMLGISGDHGHMQPMAPHADPKTNTIWFFTRTDTDLALAIKPGTRSRSGFRETIWRWRDDFQNDFAARMDWTTRGVGEANHPPVVRLGQADRLTVRSGAGVLLSARGTSDPDGDSLSYHWFAYLESGTCPGGIALSGAESLYERTITIPAFDRPCEAHFILRVTDKGAPPLTRYARVIVTIRPANGG